MMLAFMNRADLKRVPRRANVLYVGGRARRIALIQDGGDQPRRKHNACFTSNDRHARGPGAMASLGAQVGEHDDRNVIWFWRGLFLVLRSSAETTLGPCTAKSRTIRGNFRVIIVHGIRDGSDLHARRMAAVGARQWVVGVAFLAALSARVPFADS